MSTNIDYKPVLPRQDEAKQPVPARGKRKSINISEFIARFKREDISAFELHTLDGAVHRLGHGDTVKFKIIIKDKMGETALAALDDYLIGKAYMDGHIDVYGDFLAAFELRAFVSDNHPWLSLLRFIKPLVLGGQVKHDKKHVPNHYDKGNEFYFSFVDSKHRLYSQALYRADDETLEQAADNKLNYIYDICRLGQGSHVLDIGAGWGSFSNFAAARGVNVTMMTISHEQFKFLTDLCNGDSHPGKLNVVYESIYAYRPDEKYDAVVLLGVMEHLPNYKDLFRKFDQILKPGGRVYMDFVATRKKFNVSTFTHQFVFEGNHSPVVMRDLWKAADKGPFEVIAIHNDRHSYFLTAKAWAQRLQDKRTALSEKFGENNVRLFELYLWSVANCLYRDGDLESYRVVFQKAFGSPSTGIGVYRAV